MKYIIIKKKNIQPALWGGGKTFEYFIYPPAANYKERNFLFRVSSATIEEIPSDFTRFEGFVRYLVMLGNPLKIIHNGKEKNYSENEIFKFDSNDQITSLSSGTDFNLMAARSVGFSSVEIISELHEITADFILIFAGMNTKIQFGTEKIILEKNDLLCIENQENKKIKMKSSQKVIIGLVKC